MAKTNNSITLPVIDIKTNFFVRKRLNEDHVVTLADLYDHGVELPPLTVSEDPVGSGHYQLIDGRHRLEALRLIDRKEAACTVAHPSDYGEMISTAMKANIGGSLPPTKEDIEHTIVLMLTNGVARTKIYDLLPFPKPMVRRYMDLVQTELARTRAVRALDAIATHGYTVAEAAKKFDVNPEALKLKIAGKKKGIASNIGRDIKSAAATRARSLSNTNIQVFKKLFGYYEEGEMSSAQVIEVFDAIRNGVKNNLRVVEQYRARFQALSDTSTNASGPGTRATPEEYRGAMNIRTQ